MFFGLGNCRRVATKYIENEKQEEGKGKRRGYRKRNIIFVSIRNVLSRVVTRYQRAPTAVCWRRMVRSTIAIRVPESATINYHRAYHIYI